MVNPAEAGAEGRIHQIRRECAAFRDAEERYRDLLGPPEGPRPVSLPLREALRLEEEAHESRARLAWAIEQLRPLILPEGQRSGVKPIALRRVEERIGWPSGH